MIALHLLQRFGTTLRLPLPKLPDLASIPGERRQILVNLSLFVFIGTLFFARLGHRELYSSHEARAAQNAQRMIDTGEWGLPVLFDGRVDLQKPPGYYWSVAVIGSLNGGHVTEWVTRFPAAFSGLLCTVLVYGFLRQAGRPTAAVIAAISLATANHFVGITRTARIDVPLACAVTISLLAFYRGCRCHLQAEDEGRTGHWSNPFDWHVLAAIAAAVSVLLKGLVGPALIGPAAIVWLVVERFTQDRNECPRVPLFSWFLIPTLVAAIAVPWFLWSNQVTDGEFFRVFFLHHTLARYTGSSPQLASHPWWYYVPRFIGDFMPWTPFLNFLSIWLLRTGRWRQDPIFRFALIACTMMMTIMSTSHFKRADYLLPAYPFAAIVFACAAESWLASRLSGVTVRVAKWAFGGTIGVGIVCFLVMMFVIEPREEQKEQKRRFAAVIRSHAPAPQVILQYRMESHLLSYHLGRPVYTFVEWSELNEILAQPGPHFVVMPTEYVYPANEIVKSRKLVQIARLEDYTHGKPLRPLVFLRTVD